MLVLSRYVGERVRIRVGGVDVWVMVTAEDRGKIRLGFVAPDGVEILREELIGADPPHPKEKR